MVKTITKKQWEKTPKDYKSIKNGVRYVLGWSNKGTTLFPVEVTGMKKPKKK